MKFGKLLIAGIAAASMATPAVSAIRPSVKPVVVTAQKGITPGVHRAGRTGAELKDANAFLPFLGGGLFGVFASSAVTLTTLAAVNRFVVRLPGLSNIFDSIGVGRADPPASPGS